MGPNYRGKRPRELSAEDEEKVAKGRKKFSATNDDADLDAAEILFRMCRQEPNLESLAKSVDVIEHCKDETSLQNIVHGGSAVVIDQQPPIGYHIDGTKLPRLPPLKRLQKIIERCSKPFIKQLTSTDLSCTHNRLSFSNYDVRRAILPLLNVLNYRNEDIVDGIKVTTYDHRGKEYQMVFKAWANEKFYVLNTVGWNHFVSVNQLLAYRDWVTVWMFRRKNTGKLCFALDINRFTSTPNLIKKRYI